MSNAGFRPQEIHRRKFQQAVAQTFDAQAQAIQVTREFVADLSRRVDNQETLTADYDRYARWFESLTFLGRLRWLVAGR